MDNLRILSETYIKNIDFLALILSVAFILFGITFIILSILDKEWPDIFPDIMTLLFGIIISFYIKGNSYTEYKVIQEDLTKPYYIDLNIYEVMDANDGIITVRKYEEE